MGRIKAKSIRFGRLIFLVVLVCLIGRSGYGAPWAGGGTSSNPYQIWTAAEMQAIGADPNYWDAYFKLLADIDLGAYTGTSFNIIGKFVWFDDPDNTPFTGVFDGDGHTISNFTYDSSGVNGVALFGYVDDYSARIMDLGLIDPNINAEIKIWYTGALVGCIKSGTIINCYVEGGSVWGGVSCVGGLVGYNEYGDIQGCYSTCEVKGRADHVGGLVGATYWDITDCYSTGGVTGYGTVGGLVGNNQGGYITNCYSAGDVRGDFDVGGLAGQNSSGLVSNCYSTGDVTGIISVKANIGGLVGESTGDIENSYSTGNVSGYERIGGLVGGSSGDIENCYSMGSATGNEKIGGLLGYNRNGKIQVCYSMGGVTGITDAGGLVGYNDDGGGIKYCHSTGSITGEINVGGLVGRNKEDIRESYSTGNVAGVSNAGGLVGWNYSGGADVVDCYSTGSVTGEINIGGLVGNNYYGNLKESYSAGGVAGDINVGGLIGSDEGGDYFTACFWDSDVNPSLGGIGNSSDLNVIGLPTADMQTESTYTDAGWDFEGETANGTDDIWKMNCEGVSYPKLSWWEPALGDFICPDGVNFLDFAVFGDAWFSELGDLKWNSACDISEPKDGVIDGRDLEVLAENWLE